MTKNSIIIRISILRAFCFSQLRKFISHFLLYTRERMLCTVNISTSVLWKLVRTNLWLGFFRSGFIWPTCSLSFYHSCFWGHTRWCSGAIWWGSKLGCLHIWHVGHLLSHIPWPYSLCLLLEGIFVKHKMIVDLSICPSVLYIFFHMYFEVLFVCTCVYLLVEWAHLSVWHVASVWTWSLNCSLCC